MEVEVAGSIGTCGSLVLRLGQIVFSVASLLFMYVGADQFYAYTSFCFLVTIHGLTIPWGLTMAMVDASSVFVKRRSRQLQMVTIFVIGDWVLSLLSLAAACSTANVADFIVSPDNGGFVCVKKVCSRYQVSVVMAFMSWFLSITSAILNFWLLPTLYQAANDEFDV